MRKIILCLLCIALFTSLTACKNDAVVNTNSTNTTLSTTVTASITETSPTETTPLIDSLSFADYMQWLKDYAEKEGFLGVQNLSQSNVAENPNSITYSCDYDENLVSLNISTENEKVALIYSTTSPYTIIDKGIASDMSDAQMIAYSLALEPIVGVNDEWDHSWHLQQFMDAQEQGDSTSMMRTYTKDDWSFTVIIGNALVSISALDNSNSFDNSSNGNTSGSGNISNDGNNSSSSNTSNDDNNSNSSNTSNDDNNSNSSNNSDSSNTSNDGNNSCGSNTSNDGNNSSGDNFYQQPTSCSHNYEDATCTTPQTCTLCGETSGAALGHSYSVATCTEPKTCTKCNATSGSAAGHKWTDITKTIQHEEQGHYEDVEEAKKENKYRCPRCGYNEPTYATKDAYYSHFDSAHGTELNSEFDRDRYEVVEEWVYETVKEWVVDEEAYTETVVTGRKCDTCGKEE